MSVHTVCAAGLSYTHFVIHYLKAKKHAAVVELANLLLSVPNWTHPAVVSAVYLTHTHIPVQWFQFSVLLDALPYISQQETTLKQEC